MTNQQSIDKLQSLSLWLDKDSALYQAIVMAISALQALDEIYAFIMKSEASETTDGVLEIFDALQAQDVPDTNVGKMDGDELDEAIRHCDEIVQDITWFCNSPSKYIEQRRHESAVKLRQLASWLKELKRLRAQEPCEDAVSRESILSILRENYRRLGLTDKAFMELCSLMKSEPPAQPESEERKAESAQNVTKEDLISRKAAIDGKISIQRANGVEIYSDEAVPVEYLKRLPSVQPETYKEKLKEIADALSEKFAYMNSCLNERDIILGYLGVKRTSKIHCNTDCTNIKCESYRYNKRLPPAQPEIIRCKDCKHFGVDRYKKLTWCSRINYGYGYQADDFCSKAERRTDGV